jgi:hypothetical protein
MDDDWLIKQMAQDNPPCWRCGKPGRRCIVEYTRSGRTREKVYCENCADIVTRQHKYLVRFHAAALTADAGGDG